jgi:hypothetical protein
MFIQVHPQNGQQNIKFKNKKLIYLLDPRTYSEFSKLSQAALQILPKCRLPTSPPNVNIQIQLIATNNKCILIAVPSIFNNVKDIQQMLISSSLLCLLVPLLVSASRCHLQGVTISLFISYSRLSEFRVGVGYCSSGVAICCGMSMYLLYDY